MDIEYATDWRTTSNLLQQLLLQDLVDSFMIIELTLI